MNLKQMKQTAPDLFGTTFHAATFTPQLYIDQCRQAGMLSAAWAIEELARRVAELEEAVDTLPDSEAVAEALRRITAADTLVGELQELADDPDAKIEEFERCIRNACKGLSAELHDARLNLE